MHEPILTVLVQFHREGHLVYPALRSAVVAVDQASKHGIAIRLVAGIDRGDSATRAQVARFRSQLHQVLETDFGDLSQARNHAVASVQTRYLAFLDGDDLFDRDWLWKGVQHLQAHDDRRTVVHAQVRLSFGAEHHGRIQFSTDSPLFHPLNLVSSWHYAADLIAPSELLRQQPYVPNDLQKSLGGEDWHWVCETVAQGIRHLVVPETAYFYRRQSSYTSLGSVAGLTFAPTRLLDRASVMAMDITHPSAAIRFADRSAGLLGDQRRWTTMPTWLKASVQGGIAIDLELYNLYQRRHQVLFETPPLLPAIGHFYRKLMAQLREGRPCTLFFCDRLSPENLGVLEDFLAVHRQRQTADLDVLVVALGPLARWDGPSAPAMEAEVGPDCPHLHLRHVDLGADPAFVRLWEPFRNQFLIRFLMQARPSLVVNLDSGMFDGLMADFGPAVRSRTVRICRAQKDNADLDPDWSGLMWAEANYQVALCRNPQVAEALYATFAGSGMQVVAADRQAAPDDGPSMGATLHGWLAGDEPRGLADGSPMRAPATQPNRVPELTVLVPVYREGYHMNRTLHVLAGMNLDGLSMELVVASGVPGSRTARVLDALPNRWPGVRLVRTGVDDPGAVLNAGVAAAQGRLLAIMPAGDMVSPDWLARAARICQDAGPNAIVHPQALLEYGSELRLRLQPDMGQPDCDLTGLACRETWTGHALAMRELFQRIPYPSVPAGCGFGHPVWHWNCETVAQGCQHMTVADSAVFRNVARSAAERRRALGKHHEPVLPPSNFFRKHRWLRQSDLAEPDCGWNEAGYLAAHADVDAAVRSGTCTTGHQHYRHSGRAEARSVPGRGSRSEERARLVAPPEWDDAAYLDAHHDVARNVTQGGFASGYAHYCLHGRLEGRAPAWSDRSTASPRPKAPAPHARPWPRLKPPEPGPALLSRRLDQDLRGLARFDRDLMHPITPLPAPYLDPWLGQTYRRCWRTIAAIRPTHIMVTPALRTGGAERAMLMCIDAIVENPAHRVLIITTDSRDNRWHQALPSRCTWLPFPPEDEAPASLRAELLTRVLLNSGARCLHLFLSHLGWNMLRTHAAALASRLRVFVSIYSVPQSDLGPENAGYAPYIPTLVPHLSGILTDNRTASSALQEVCGIPGDRITVLQHPVTATARFAGPSPDSNLVLWAGRLDGDKRPDLLRDIAGRMPALRFHVYGVPVLSNHQEIERLRAVPNIEYRGPFEGFDGIPAAPYHCFLYTSQHDGMPNTLLESMKAGLLVVASDVGGVSEVVGEDTGVLVRPADRPDAYVEALTRTLSNREAWVRVAAQGQQRVTEGHSHEGFLQTLRRIPGYLSDG